MLTKYEEDVYVFALRYASGRHTYAWTIVIHEIIEHLPEFPRPESFLQEIDIREMAAERNFNPWDTPEEKDEFYRLEKAVESEIERRRSEMNDRN